MSKISLAPDASGTGIFTIASPGTSTNRTLTLPDDTGTIVTNSGNQAGSFTTLNTSGAVVFNDAGADVDFRVEGDTDANLLFVDASTDRVGIGTSTPGDKLDIRGGGLQVQQGASNSANFSIITSSTPSSGTTLRSSWSGTGSQGPLIFDLGGTERARIDTSGNLLVGVTSGSSKAVLAQSADDPALTLNCTNGSFVDSALVIYTTRATTNSSYAQIACYNGDFTGQFVVRDSGNVVNTNNSYGAISDVKLKQDIVDAGSQWDDIKGLRVRKFHWKSDPDGFLQVGLIAQEAELVSPGLIDEYPDYEDIEVPVLDNEGNPVLNEDGTPQVTKERNALGTTTKAVKYSVLYMKAVKALQEAIERIETLEASNTALEAV